MVLDGFGWFWMVKSANHYMYVGVAGILVAS
jgi:hypothetical protein